MEDQLKDEIKSFFDYLNGSPDLIKVFNQIQELTKDYEKHEYLNTHKKLPYELNLEIMKPEIVKFFSEYFSLSKALEVKQILDGKSKYFTDSDGYHVYFLKNDFKVRSMGYVCIRENNKCNELYVYLNNTLNDYFVAVHELAHSISAHKKQPIDSFNEGQIDQVYIPQHDVILEVESYITEALFFDYMIKQGKLNFNDFRLYYENQCHMLHNILYQYSTRKEEKKVVMMQNTPPHRKFRYVFGGILAAQWIRKYESSQDEREQMKKTFCDYLGKTSKSTLDIDLVSQMLLGKNFTEVAKDFKDIFEIDREKAKPSEDKNLTNERVKN